MLENGSPQQLAVTLFTSCLQHQEGVPNPWLQVQTSLEHPTSANDFEPDQSLPYSKSDLVSLTELNWHIIVEVNPDGYQYTHNNDRMWRKNRSLNPGMGFLAWYILFLPYRWYVNWWEPKKGEPCRGTDLNRNFPVGHLTRGGGSNSCSFRWIHKQKPCIKKYFSIN